MEPTVPQRIRHFARLSGKSQVQIATEMGVTPSAVSQWMDDEGTNPRHDRIPVLCKVLGIDLPTFYGPLEEEEAGDEVEGDGGKSAAAGV